MGEFRGQPLGGTGIVQRPPGSDLTFRVGRQAPLLYRLKMACRPSAYPPQAAETPGLRNAGWSCFGLGRRRAATNAGEEERNGRCRSRADRRDETTGAGSRKYSAADRFPGHESSPRSVPAKEELVRARHRSRSRRGSFPHQARGGRAAVRPQANGSEERTP